MPHPIPQLIIFSTLLLLVSLSATMPGVDAAAEGSSSCAHSVFETRGSWIEMAPDENSKRLTGAPQTHPDKVLCGSYAGKPSCCTKEMLQELARWSDTADAFTTTSKYLKWKIENEPEQAVDAMLIGARSFVPDPSKIKWEVLRTVIRQRAAKLVYDFWKLLDEPTTAIWQSIVTYQEGILCSACEPDFAPRYMNPEVGQIKMKLAAAQGVWDAVFASMDAFDQFFNDEARMTEIKNLVKDACFQALGGGLQCNTVPIAVGLAVNFVTGNELRQMFCGKPPSWDNNGANDHCRDMFMNRVLRGLFIDVSPIVDNLFAFAKKLCGNAQGVIDCSPLDKAQVQSRAWFYSFDTRVLATNVYVVEGYDLLSTACASHLSGYACGGSGPQSLHAGGGGNGGGFDVGSFFLGMGVMLGALAVGACAMTGYWRRARDVVSPLFGGVYTKMRDGGTSYFAASGSSSASGPLAGLV